ncbi:hypothetical protein BpHYR1_011429 [Brachionus plicatilis]|uniref:Uncharacterized protein n=1 Tax=Brachionus plicatilis TaxID=10195 RepID=A0A3M7RFA7_BRAPC|nr:hypothetical protein BpHYR1_011429 [Brachionus plicatilis]
MSNFRSQPANMTNRFYKKLKFKQNSDKQTDNEMLVLVALDSVVHCLRIIEHLQHQCMNQIF